MVTLDLKKIITKSELDYRVVAENLFPNNKFAKVALDRVVEGKAFLDTNQLVKLAMLVGAPTVDDLFKNNGWKVSASPKKIIFIQDDYRAELDTVNWTARIFKKDSLCYEEEIIVKKSLVLSEYTEELNKIILKIK